MRPGQVRSQDTRRVALSSGERKWRVRATVARDVRGDFAVEDFANAGDHVVVRRLRLVTLLRSDSDSTGPGV